MHSVARFLMPECVNPSNIPQKSEELWVHSSVFEWVSKFKNEVENVTDPCQLPETRLL